MSVVSLQDDVSHFQLAGFTLNVEERAALTSSLLLKKSQEKLSSVSFWGKINGIQRDYYIATSQNTEGPDLFQPKFFYSLDLVNWLYLPTVTPTEIKAIDSIQSQFRGDPGYVYPFAGKDGQEPEVKSLTEEQRLAGIIAQINYDVHIVPRGAYMKDAAHAIVRNPDFSGLSASEIALAQNYFHFRLGYSVHAEDISARLDSFDENIDIFQSVADDKPAGVWSIQSGEGGAVALVKSLLWPGYTFFSSRGTSTAPGRFGALYFGTGQKNQNIGFML